MHKLFATTSKGLYAFTLTGEVSLIGLQDNVVSQASARDGTLLAAVPVIHQVHQMMSYVDSDSRKQQSGLYKFDLSAGSGASTQPKIVHTGNIKSCAIGKESSTGKQRWYAGAEPADVLISEDSGVTWSDTGSFKAIPARQEWYGSQKAAIPRRTFGDARQASTVPKRVQSLCSSADLPLLALD